MPSLWAAICLKYPKRYIILLPFSSGSSFGNVAVDSARQNLASSFVNAFLNAGFGADKLLMDEKSKWIYKNKDMGKNMGC